MSASSWMFQLYKSGILQYTTENHEEMTDKLEAMNVMEQLYGDYCVYTIHKPTGLWKSTKDIITFWCEDNLYKRIP